MLITVTRRRFCGAVATGAFTFACPVTAMNRLREKMERGRTAHAANTPREVKQELGQYFTPGHIADFMASLFPQERGAKIRILDPGAGIGILSCALIERMTDEKWDVSDVCAEAYEIDKSLICQLQGNLVEASSGINALVHVKSEDFLFRVAQDFKNGVSPAYTHVIMNPPYKKIRTESPERRFAREIGLETVNLYTAFMGAAIVSTVNGGRIVAIVPRSFCNGAYYKPFREFMLERCSIERVHLFDSRDTAFKDDSVLQENIIIMICRGGKQGDVVVSNSADGTLSNVQTNVVPFSQIIFADDAEKYINIPSGGKSSTGKSLACFNSSLNEICLQVSTGAVVDFRMRDHLRKDPERESIPLLYPIHFHDNRVRWPASSKKPNAIKLTSATEKVLLPRGYYVAVKRFSSKEERRRIVASIVTPNDFKSNNIAFENHLNVFMCGKHGLEGDVAYGLTVWLNTTWLDNRFRLFSGHTQVNATDLRNLPYPSLEHIRKMGRKLEKHVTWTQRLFDSIAEEVANEK